MKALRGMTLIDVLVGSALVLIVLVVLLGLLRSSLLISSLAKAKAGATAVADTQMEYLRSLPYDSVGTVGGIPAGLVPQNATTTLNGIAYATRTFVGYVDDEKDGTGGSDITGITTDYKRVRVSVSYAVRGLSHEIVLVSNIAPPGLETTNGGGTLRANIVNAAGTGVAGASVRVENPSVSPAVDVTTFSDATGLVLLPGAPTSTDYRITVTKSGYSSAQTYARDATNQNPTPGYLTIAENQTTSSTFSIDTLASFILRTFSPVQTGTWTDTFTDSTQLATMSGTTVSGGALLLITDEFGYVTSGTARTVAIAPTYLAAWKTVDGALSTPGGTAVTVQVGDGTGSLIPDGVLPGNSTGFTSFPISLGTIATTTYPSLTLLATLTSSVSAATPHVFNWTVSYDEGPLPLAGVPFTLTGAKTIGTTGAGASLYKTEVASTTEATGTFSSLLEWDIYSIVPTGYTIKVASSTPTPFILDPGATFEATLILE